MCWLTYSIAFHFIPFKSYCDADLQEQCRFSEMKESLGLDADSKVLLVTIYFTCFLHLFCKNLLHLPKLFVTTFTLYWILF